MEDEPSTFPPPWLPKLDPVAVSIGLCVLACVVAYAYSRENKRLRQYLSMDVQDRPPTPCKGCSEKEDLEAAYYDGFNRVKGGAFNGHTDVSHGATADSLTDASGNTASGQ